MYKIEKKDFGFKLTFGETIAVEEMEQWVKDSETALKSCTSDFGVFIDMRTLKPVTNDARTIMEKGQKLYKQGGMTRSVVIVDSAIMAMQFKRLAKESGIYTWERYIDASSNSDWEKIGENWITKSLDPDEKVPAGT
ncbi:MAG: hypothetical protein KAR42_00640 [candidate division Zixibacteria bacterium]|nr:hypothetical protein [candidate division Zixibacteria bacterium]